MLIYRFPRFGRFEIEIGTGYGWGLDRAEGELSLGCLWIWDTTKG